MKASPLKAPTASNGRRQTLAAERRPRIFLLAALATPGSRSAFAADPAPAVFVVLWGENDRINATRLRPNLPRGIWARPQPHRRGRGASGRAGQPVEGGRRAAISISHCLREPTMPWIRHTKAVLDMIRLGRRPPFDDADPRLGPPGLFPPAAACCTQQRCPRRGRGQTRYHRRPGPLVRSPVRPVTGQSGNRQADVLPALSTITAVRLVRADLSIDVTAFCRRLRHAGARPVVFFFGRLTGWRPSTRVPRQRRTIASPSRNTCFEQRGRLGVSIPPQVASVADSKPEAQPRLRPWRGCARRSPAPPLAFPTADYPATAYDETTPCPARPRSVHGGAADLG